MDTKLDYHMHYCDDMWLHIDCSCGQVSVRMWPQEREMFRDFLESNFKHYSQCECRIDSLRFEIEKNEESFNVFIDTNGVRLTLAVEFTDTDKFLSMLKD